MARDLLKSHSPDALRLYLGNHHYRQVWSHNDEELVQAEQRARLLREAVVVHSGTGPAMDDLHYLADFVHTMDLDLGAPAALTILKQLGEAVIAASHEGRNVRQAQETIRSLGAIFGLRLDADRPEARVIEGWNRHLARF
jgi:cysteinyl-tRNA synthetase